MSRTPLTITGMGMLNALGLGREAYWSRLLEGACGIAPIEEANSWVHGRSFGAKIPSFDPRDYMPPRYYRRLSRLSRLAVAASIEAVQDNGMSINDLNRHRIGVILGSAFGSTDQSDAFFLSLLQGGPAAAEPILFPDTVPNAPTSHVAMYHQLHGPNSTFCQNHLSGECALAYATTLIEQGRVDALMVVGVDELSPILYSSLHAIRALKTSHRMGISGEDGLSYQPGWLASGKGFIAGEGATCLVLEPAVPAVGLRMRSYGSLRSLVLTSGPAAQGHYPGNEKALVDAMRSALHEAGLKPEDIDILGLASNGVEELEDMEAAAMYEVFGVRWHLIPRTPVRYFTGEFGSAGLLTVVTLLLALNTDTLPPHVLGVRLTGIPGDPQRFHPAKQTPLRFGMALGATFGGGCSCVIVSKRG